MHPMIVVLCLLLGLAGVAAIVSVAYGFAEDPMRRASTAQRQRMSELLADPALPKRLRVEFDPDFSAIPSTNWSGSRLKVGGPFFDLADEDQLTLLQWGASEHRWVASGFVVIAWIVLGNAGFIALVEIFVRMMQLSESFNYQIVGFVSATFTSTAGPLVREFLLARSYKARLRSMVFGAVAASIYRAHAATKQSKSKNQNDKAYEEWNRICKRLGYGPELERVPEAQKGGIA